MRILWICNTLPATAARMLNRKIDNKEGWLDGILSRIAADEDIKRDISLAIAYPGSDNKTGGQTVDINDHFKLTVYEYTDDRPAAHIYDERLESEFTHIYESYKPEIIHIFGTEYGHNLAAAKTAAKLRNENNRPSLLIGIQGIISECAREYTADMPYKQVTRYSLRDLLKNDNVARQQDKFRKRGEFELNTVSYATDITGRTAFDREWSEKFSPNAKYHHMNETLRSMFYTGTWDVTDCDRHVIFISQGDYPLKGVHNVIRAVSELKGKYPDIRLIVAGADIISADSLKSRIKLSGYGRYLRELIAEFGLKEHVIFTGPLDAEKMKRMYLRSHIYLCASSVENSPNSMGEAMLLGLPVVAHRAGGIPSMIEDGVEGILYNTVEEMTEAIDRIWSDDALATELGAHAILRAKATHDPDVNFGRLLEIYEQIR